MIQFGSVYYLHYDRLISWNMFNIKAITNVSHDKNMLNDTAAPQFFMFHYNDVIMSAMASQITGVSIVWSTLCSATQQRKLQSSASLAFVRGIRRWPVNSPHKGSVTQEMFPFDDVIIFLPVYSSRLPRLRFVFLHRHSERSTLPEEIGLLLLDLVKPVRERDFMEICSVSHRICTWFGCAFFRFACIISS